MNNVQKPTTVADIMLYVPLKINYIEKYYKHILKASTD
jgi:hypothetical protein